MTLASNGPGADSAPEDWIDRFEPVRLAGQSCGTRSVVCRDRLSRTLVVVREIDPAVWWHGSERRRAQEALRREAEVMDRLGRTPGGALFPVLLESALESDSPWIAIERLDGQTLRDRFPLGADGRIPSGTGWTLPQTLHAILSLRDGLRVLHQIGSAHGLIHPEALILTGTGGESVSSEGPRLRLRSLGWAAAPSGQMVIPDRAALPYVDPAALRGPGAPGPESDAWSLAAILFELASGGPPFAVHPVSPFEHEERFAYYREAVRGPRRDQLEQMHPGVATYLDRILRDGRGAPPAAGADPRAIEDLFSGLAGCRESARGDPLWSQVPLPSPDLQDWKRRLRRPPSLEQIDRYKGLVQRWRLATQSMVEALRLVADLGQAPWAGWKREVDEDAASCLARDPIDADALHEASLLVAECERVETRLAGLDRVASEGGDILRRRLEQAAQESADLETPESAELKQAIETLRAQPVPTPALFLQTARLVPRLESLRQDAGRHRAKRAFDEAVAAMDWARAGTILEAWPGGADDTCRALARGLAAWIELERSVSTHLTGKQTAQGLASARDALVRLEGAAPAGFESAARRLAGRLSAVLDGARGESRAALEQARAFCAAQQEAAALAAERSLLEDLPDHQAAAVYCRELQALEREIAGAARRLEQAVPDFAFQLELPRTILALRERAAAARAAWWTRDGLPRPRREWTAFADKVSALAGKGRGGIAAAHRLRDTQAPVGWEEWARALKIPPVPPPDRRRWIAMAAAGGVLAASVLVVINLDALRGIVSNLFGPRPGASQQSRTTPLPPLPTPAPPMETQSARDTQPARRIWAYGPAHSRLQLEVKDGETRSFALPGFIDLPAGAPANIRLVIGERTSEGAATPADANVLQKTIDGLAAGATPSAEHRAPLEAQVRKWAEEILDRGAP